MLASTGFFSKGESVQKSLRTGDWQAFASLAGRGEAMEECERLSPALLMKLGTLTAAVVTIGLPLLVMGCSSAGTGHSDTATLAKTNSSAPVSSAIASSTASAAVPPPPPPSVEAPQSASRDDS